jgi:hypothetical protein
MLFSQKEKNLIVVLYKDRIVKKFEKSIKKLTSASHPDSVRPIRMINPRQSRAKSGLPLDLQPISETKGFKNMFGFAKKHAK